MDEIIDNNIRQQYEQETDAPFMDSLSGLFNYGFFQIAFKREIASAERYGYPFSLGLVDIDLFEGFNKQSGFIKGDRMIRTVAVVLQETLRDVDFAARFSGNVFAVLLSRTDSRSANIAAERFRQAVEKASGTELTVSIGLASYPEDALSSNELLIKAEEALSTAKSKGKNRVCFFEKSISSVVDKTPQVLIVDDEPQNVKLLEAQMMPLKYKVFKAYNGNEALSIIKRFDLDIILLDIMMPGINGYQVCRRIKNNEATRMLPVIMFTALGDTEARVKGIDAGADDFITKPSKKVELLARIKSLIKTKRLNNSLTSIESVLFSLANAVEAKDKYTQGHTDRVSSLAVSLGKKLGFSGEDLAALKVGGILHDIGKIAVPDKILNKPGPLDPEEMEIMKSHADAGYRICLPLKKNLSAALEVIRHHHEKLDGTGYPDGLKGEEISKSAKIMGVVDIYDALVSDRPYREGMPREKALSILNNEAEAGKIDSRIVAALVEMVG